jgi:hypothetical protein
MRRGLAVILAAGITAALIALIFLFALIDDPLAGLRSIWSHLIPE